MSDIGTEYNFNALKNNMSELNSILKKSNNDFDLDDNFSNIGSVIKENVNFKYDGGYKHEDDIDSVENEFIDIDIDDYKTITSEPKNTDVFEDIQRQSDTVKPISSQSNYKLDNINIEDNINTIKSIFPKMQQNISDTNLKVENYPDNSAKNNKINDNFDSGYNPEVSIFSQNYTNSSKNNYNYKEDYNTFAGLNNLNNINENYAITGGNSVKLNYNKFIIVFISCLMIIICFIIFFKPEYNKYIIGKIELNISFVIIFLGFVLNLIPNFYYVYKYIKSSLVSDTDLNYSITS